MNAARHRAPAVFPGRRGVAHRKEHGVPAVLDVERRTANGAPAIRSRAAPISRAVLVTVVGRSVPLCNGAVIGTTTVAATATAMATVPVTTTAAIMAMAVATIETTMRRASAAPAP